MEFTAVWMQQLRKNNDIFEVVSVIRWKEIAINVGLCVISLPRN